ncbi:MAG: hypothetical protein ACTSR8_22660, partial [Promethearchaeota archaeon]
MASSFTSIFLGHYFLREKGPEVDLLKGISGYTEQYEGETPGDALRYVQETLKLAGKNETLREYVGKLEKEISEIIPYLKDPKTPNIYKPVLNDISLKIDKIV